MPTSRTTVRTTFDLEDIKKLLARELGIDPKEIKWIKDKQRSKAISGIDIHDCDYIHYFDGIEVEFDK